MSQGRIIKNSFAAGEMSPRLYGRVDLENKFRAGASLIKNFIPLAQGPLIRRPGFKFISELGAYGKVRIVSFSPNSTDSFVLVFSDEKVEFYRATDFEFSHSAGTITPKSKLTFKETGAGADVTSLTLPYGEDDLADLDFQFSVDRIVICHVDYPPRVIEYWSASAPLGFRTSEYSFFAPGFLPADTSKTSIRLVDEQYILKITSTVDEGFDHATAGTDYVEFRYNNKWALGRILGTATTPAAPANPTTHSCYIEPVTAVVEDIDPATRMVLLPSAYDSSEIPANKYHVRADTKVFNYDLVGAWMRIQNSYENVDTPGTYVDDEFYWVKIEDYLSVRDYPTKFLVNPADTDLEDGHVYKITARTSGSIRVASDNGGTGGFVYDTAGRTFSATPKFAFSSPVGWVLHDLSSRKTFDVVEVDDGDVLEVGNGVISCTGSVTIDPVYEQTGRTGTLIASAALFNSTTDVGRYILAQHGTKYVLYKITAVNSSTDADVIIVDGDVPKLKNRDEYVNEGRSTLFHFSAWYTGSYPKCSAFYEQRLFFAGSPSAPETVWGSKTTDNSDFRPVENDGLVLDTSGITYDLSGPTLNSILWLSPGATLLVGTRSGVWQIKPNTFSEAITPKNIRISQEATAGNSRPGVRIGSSVMLLDSSKNVVREMFYDYQVDGFSLNDTTLLADHILADDSAVEMHYQQAPRSIVWFVTEGGLMLGLAYIRDQNVYAWFRLVTDGAVLSACVIPGLGLTPEHPRLVVAVVRDSGLMLEVLETEFVDSGADNWKPNLNFLDSSARFPGGTGYLASPVTSLAGLSHLDGVEVSIVIDGAYTGTGTVSAGGLTLPQAANKYVLIGLPFTSTVTTLPLLGESVAIGTTFLSQIRVTEISLLVHQSLGLSLTFGTTQENVSFRSESGYMDQSPELYTGAVKVPVTDTYSSNTTFTISQTLPYPLTVLAIAGKITTET